MVRCNERDLEMPRLGLTAYVLVNLYLVTKIFLYFSFTVHCFYAEISSFTLFSSIWIVFLFFLFAHILLWEILNLNLTFAVKERDDNLRKNKHWTHQRHFNKLLKRKHLENIPADSFCFLYRKIPVTRKNAFFGAVISRPHRIWVPRLL